MSIYYCQRVVRTIAFISERVAGQWHWLERGCLLSYRKAGVGCGSLENLLDKFGEAVIKIMIDMKHEGCCINVEGKSKNVVNCQKCE